MTRRIIVGIILSAIVILALSFSDPQDEQVHCDPLANCK